MLVPYLGRDQVVLVPIHEAEVEDQVVVVVAEQLIKEHALIIQ